jgi:uncharacterized protein (DUF1697 family)
MPTPVRYVALLRGINVGGHKKVPMVDLRKLYGSLGFEDVVTLLNSGNVVFTGGRETEKKLVQRIESAFRKRFGFESRTMVRTMSEIESLIALNPFKRVKVDKNIRLYVSFLREKARSPIKLPYRSPQQNFRILKKTDREVFSVLDVKTARSVDAMAFVEETYGNDLTTRNWNTVQKIATR